MQPTKNSLGMLLALSQKGHVYGGTVTDKDKQQRRRKNKQQRESRRKNR